MYKQHSAFTHALTASYIHAIIMYIHVLIHRYHACRLRHFNSLRCRFCYTSKIFNYSILARLEDFVDLCILINLNFFVEFNILLHLECFVDRHFTILRKFYTVRHFTTFRRFCRPTRFTTLYLENVSNLSWVLSHTYIHT